MMGAGGVVLAGGESGVGLEEFGLAHVPGRGRAALGAETAVDAQVFVLDHDAARVLEVFRDEERLREVERRYAVSCPRSSSSGALGVMVRQLSGQTSMQASHSMQNSAVK
jgi:hypothetical protein